MGVGKRKGDVEMENNSQIQPYANAESFALAQRMAMSLSESTLVPQDFRGKLGMSNCIIAIEMAGRMGISPFMCMQNLYIIQGRPSWSSQYLIGSINTSGKFSPLRWRFEKGEKKKFSYQVESGWDNQARRKTYKTETAEVQDMSCVAWAKELATGEVLEGPAVTMQMVMDEGWYGKSGSKWKTMPEVMFRYRSAALFCRMYCPEVAMGLHTAEEVRDTEEYAETKKVTPQTKTDRAEMARKITEDLLGAGEEAAPTEEEAPVIEAELKSETTGPEKAEKAEKETPKKPDKADKTDKAEQQRAERVKKVFNAYLLFLKNDTDAAQREMTALTEKSDTKNWSEQDVAFLWGNLGDLKSGKATLAAEHPFTLDELLGKRPPEPSQDDIDAIFDMPPMMAAGDTIEI